MILQLAVDDLHKRSRVAADSTNKADASAQAQSTCNLETLAVASHLGRAGTLAGWQQLEVAE